MKISAANSHWMAARSLEARRAAKRVALERENLLKRLLAAEENRLLAAAENPVQRPAEAPDDMQRVEMSQRLQDHMKRLDQMMEEERQPSFLAHLASARSKLFESWRILGGIPMPGSRRPTNEHKTSFTFTPPVDG